MAPITLGGKILAIRITRKMQNTIIICTKTATTTLISNHRSLEGSPPSSHLPRNTEYAMLLSWKECGVQCSLLTCKTAMKETRKCMQPRIGGSVEENK